MQPVPLSKRKFISEILMALLVICVVLLLVFGSTKPALKSGMLNQTMNVPEGIVAIDADTRHLWKTPHIGKISSDGQFDIVWDACRPLDLAPFPSYRLRDDWKHLLQTADGNLS